MEPIDAIICALRTGCIEGAPKNVKNKYKQLDRLIRRLFDDKNDLAGTAVLDEFEQNPEALWETPLKVKLVQGEVDQNSDVINTARTLLAGAGASEEATCTHPETEIGLKRADTGSRRLIDMINSRIGILGDNAIVYGNIIFQSPSAKKALLRYLADLADGTNNLPWASLDPHHCDPK